MSGHDTQNFHITSYRKIAIFLLSWHAKMNTGCWGNGFYHEDEDNTPDGGGAIRQRLGPVLDNIMEQSCLLTLAHPLPLSY